ncbi:fungal-specific transcription factor domain-containing protein [Xylogone sp. PMI_703]|nr:fungal-specific transcription factor domain-containing protein [Xylogone sp. PMI_703]
MEPRSQETDNTSQSFNSAAPLATVSCNICRLRKVACDHHNPCANCVRRNEVCSYLTSTSRRTRGPGKHNRKELLKKIDRMEALIKVYATAQRDSPSLDNSNPEVPTGNKVSESTPSPIIHDHSSPSGSQNGGVSLIFKEGKSAYTTDALFAELSSQIEDIHTLLDEDHLEIDHEEQASIDSAHQVLSLGPSFLPGIGNLNIDVQYEQLDPPHVFFLWRAYLRNVDSMIKLLHTPTVQTIIEAIAQNRCTASPDLNALLCAIYFAAITSLTDDELYLMFGENRSQMFPRYKSRLEQALNRANLLNTKHLTTLQAFVLLIFCSRTIMPVQYVWMLTGLAIRIARVLGLHRDGELFQLPPFECEMRRRLWWQICFLEVKSSEESGSEISITEDSFDTKLPLNINDEDIHPDSTELPPEQCGVTDLSLTLIRLELLPTELSLHQKLKSLAPEDLPQCEELLKHKYEQIHTKYMNGPGVDDPRNTIAAAILDVVTKKISLRLHQRVLCSKQSEIPSLEMQDLLFHKSLELLESTEFLHTESSISHWEWHSRRNIQWHAIVFVLLQLCTRDSSPLMERAWKTLDIALSQEVEAVIKMEGGLHYQLIIRLLKRAKARRQQELMKSQTTPLYSNEMSDSSQAQPVTGNIGLPQAFSPLGFELGATSSSWEIGIGDQANIWETWLDGDGNLPTFC